MIAANEDKKKINYRHASDSEIHTRKKKQRTNERPTQEQRVRLK